ncbi:hypothetical protein D3C81_478260 [compost metagenome]
MNALEAAQAAVQDARKALAELENARLYVNDALPKAQQALEAAVGRLRRLTQADGTAAAASQQREIDRLTAEITAARGERNHV